MQQRYATLIAVLGFLVPAAPLFLAAQPAAQTGPSGPGPSQAQPPPAYRPGLGDLMTMTVQPRHIKLLLAGHEQNWVYAKYELHELQEAFDRAVRVWPLFKGLPLGGMVDATPTSALATVEPQADEPEF